MVSGVPPNLVPVGLIHHRRSLQPAGAPCVSILYAGTGNPSDGRTTMKSRTRKRRGCAPGCLIAFGVLVVALIITGYFVMQPINAAKQAEQNLVDTLGAVPDYVPPPDGAVAPERLEIFLRARTHLLVHTGRIQDTIARIEAIDEQEDLGAGELWGFLKLVGGSLPRMVEFFSTRNAILMAEGMSLGEYFYIYALAYGDRFCPPGDDGRPPADCEYVTGRATREYARMLRNQLDNAAHPPPAHVAAALREEVARLESGARALPWHGERPAEIEASLAPYRERLAPLFCAETRELELVQKNKNFGGIGD